MRLNELRDNVGANKIGVRVGRGIGSGKGKTCGRGGKGQTARAGVAINGFEGGQMPIYRRLPKRGFNNMSKYRISIINLGLLQKAIDSGKLDPLNRITRSILIESGLIPRQTNYIRLLAQGNINIGLTIEVDGASRASTTILTELGGQVVIMKKMKKETVLVSSHD